MALQGEEARLSRSAWRLLRHGTFGLYFAGSLTSNLGTWLQNTAQVLLAYQLTHSVFAVGVVTCAQFSGSLLLGPWAAVIASRIGSKPVLIASQVFSAAIAALMAGLAAAGQLGEGGLVAGALVIGLAFTFALPVQTALVPRLVRDANTEDAMTMNSVSYNTGRALAPALCVLVVRLTGFAWAFGLNAVSFLVFAIVLASVAPPNIPQRPARARDGVRIAARVPRVVLLLAMVAAVTFADDPILTLGPALAHHLGTGDDWAGYFLSALGCGTVAGSLLPTKRWAPGRTARLVAWPLVALVLAVALFATGFSEWVSLAAAFLAGGAALQASYVTQTQLMREAKGSEASVMAVWAIAWAGTKPLASLTDGWVASGHGLRWALTAVAGPALVLGLLELCMPDPWKDRIKAGMVKAGTKLAARKQPGAKDPSARAPAQADITDRGEPVRAPAPVPPSRQ
jgi:predicted MFS family arabinose efflux permease